jgi:hypothetical protein
MTYLECSAHTYARSILRWRRRFNVGRVLVLHSNPAVLCGAPQHCASFWMTAAALVCAEHATVATVVDRSRAKQSSNTMLLPHPSGPTNTNACPDSSLQGLTLLHFSAQRRHLLWDTSCNVPKFQ